jgi:putative ABC transport system permease protein
MDSVLSDLKYAVRMLWRSRIVAAITVLTLSLGIGVVTALFALVHGVLLRPIVPDQDRVVHISKRDTQRGDFPLALSLPEFAAWRDDSSAFETLAAVDHAATGPVATTIGNSTSPVQMAPVSAELFRLMHRGGPPLYGRWLTMADEQRGATLEVAAVVSERFWRRVSGGDPAFVGRRLMFAGTRTLIVVGVAPASADYPLGTDIWAPAATLFDGQAGRFDANSPTFSQFELIGRLAPGASIERARAELTAIHQRLAKTHANDYRPAQVIVEPLIDVVVGNGRHVLLALFAAAGLVFVIAGVNVASLLLMQASGRRSEAAIRIALGAGYARLLRQTLTESFVLATLGSAGGLVIARVLLVLVQRLAPGELPRLDHAALDLTVMAFCTAVALGWMLLLGSAPVWAQRRLIRNPRVETSISSGIGIGSRGAQGTRGLLAFTIAQIAAAVVIAIVAGLLVRTFAHLQAIERGFDADNLAMVSLLLPDDKRREPRAMLAFHRQLRDDVESLPGVTSTSPIHLGPGTGTLGLSAPLVFEGQTPEEAKKNPWSSWEPVLPSYFRTLGIPIVLGRGFGDDDRRGGAPVAIVSESVARRYWPGQNPLGKRLRVAAAAEWPWVTVIGVAADTRYRELTKSWMTVYFAADQFFFFQPASLAVRATSPLDALVPAIAHKLRALEPSAAIESVKPMEVLLARELSRPRAALMVTGVFAVVAIVLAAVGTFGVMSYEVRQRRRELAVRTAIGATPRDIFRSVVGRSLIAAIVGVTAGLLAATTVTHMLRALLFDVHPLDPTVFLSAAGILVGAILVAACIPAKRAAGIDPSVALRQE